MAKTQSTDNQDKKRKICNLSNPPDILKEIKKETKAEPTSWANEVEQQYPLETVQEEEEDQQGEQSRFFPENGFHMMQCFDQPKIFTKC